MRIVIIGAGIVGVTVAHALLDEGHAVELVDREAPAAGASAGNAGWIAHMDILPLASPKAWAHMPKWMLDPLGPLSISPAHLPKLLPWLLRFVAASRPSRIKLGSAAIHALNSASLPAWERRLATLGLEGLLRRKGILSVWTDRREFEAAAALHARQNALGIPVERLEPAELRVLEPAFGPEVVGAALYPTGAHVCDPRDFTVALHDSALARGMTFTRATVADFVPGPDGLTLATAEGTTIRTDRVVLAAGAWSKPLAAKVGDYVSLDTERGYNITVPAGTIGVTRPVMFEGQGFVVSPLDTGDRIGGAVEFAGLTRPANWKRVDAMIGRLRRVMPRLGTIEGERWMGFRPSTPDSLPVIGRSRDDTRVVHAFGHGHYGLTQAAATAEIVAALMAGRSPSIDLRPFSPQRF